MTNWVRRPVSAWILTFLSLAAFASATPQDRPPAASQATAVSPADETAIRSFIDKYYQAYGVKDLREVIAAWDPVPETQPARNLLAALFDIQDYAFSNLRVAWIRPAEAGVVARVVVDVAIRGTTGRPADAGQSALNLRTRNERWIRNLSLRVNGSGWSIWRDASASDEVVAEIVRLPTAEEQLARIAAEPDIDVKLIRNGLEREATRAFSTGDGPKAIALHQLCRTLAERAGDSELVAASEINIAFVYQSRQNHRAALEWFQKASAGFLAAGKLDRHAATEMNIGAELYAMQDYAASREHYEKALAFFDASGELGWLPTIHHNLGNIAYLQGNWDIALDHYKTSAALQEADTQPSTSGANIRARGIASAYQAMGLVYKEQGDYPSARAALEKSLARFEAANDKPATVHVREVMGLVYRLEGDFALALKEYLTAWKTAVGLPPISRDVGTEANLLAEIGDVYALEQRYATALDYLQKSLVLQEQAKSQEGIAAVLGGIGGMHFLLGHLDPAIENYQKALAAREVLGDKRNAARILAHIGLVLAAQDKPADALASYQKSLDTATADGDQPGAAIALVLIASAHAAQEHFTEALDFALKGAALASQIDDLDILAHAQLVAGDALQRTGEWDRARQALTEAIAAVGRIRSAQVSGEMRFFNDTVAPHMAMVHLLLARDQRDDAFVLLERAKLIRMQEILGGGTRIVKDLSPEEQGEERRLQKRVVSLRTQVRKAADQPQPDQTRLAALSRDLADSMAARTAFESRLVEQHPNLSVLRAKNDPPALTEGAAQVVDDRAALVEFAVTETRTYVFVATKSTAAPAAGRGGRGAAPAGPVLQVYPIDIKAGDLGKRVAQFRDAIARRDPAVQGSARELYDLLLKPADAQLAGKRRLLIVPDSVLWALPFQALQPQDGRYLIEDRAIAYAPSLTGLVAMTERDRTKASAPADTFRLVTLALSEAGKDAVDRLALVRPDLKFDPLPEAERETRAIAALFAPARARAYLGRDARTDHLTADARRAAALHVAVRGVLNDASPLHSLLAFAPVPDRAGDDGIVETVDAMDWDTTARTVVFSRLQGDPGVGTAGAGAVALAWACFVAGSPSTVLSQWIVDMPSTSLLMQAFHRNLRVAPRPGQPPSRPSEALRIAMLPLLQGKTRDPFYWAGFIVIGDAR